MNYLPAAAFIGVDSFSYTISDGQGGVATATVTVTVNPSGTVDPQDDTATVDEDAEVDIPVLANDVADDALTVESVTQGTNGAVVINANSTVKYTPTANFHGEDSFSYTVNNGKGGTASANVTVTVNSVNDDPTAADDAASVSKNSAATAIDVLANDGIDPDTDETLSISDVSDPANGTASIADGGAGLNYQPDADYVGADSFTYTISDGNGGTATATVNVTVTDVSNNDPVADDDSATVAEDGEVDIAVLDGDTDADDDALTVESVTQGANGAVSINADGTVKYIPTANFNGEDTFSYSVSDGKGGTDSAAVMVTVSSVNDNPTAVDDTATVKEGTDATVIDVLANDGIAPDTDETLTITETSDPAYGTVSIAEGGASLSYQPDADYAGGDTFTYTVSDGNGGTATATVTITVDSVNTKPVAVGDTYSTDVDTPLLVAAPGVLANDSDDDGDAMTVNLVTNPTHGSLMLYPDGSFTYAPEAGYAGPDSFEYSVSDGKVNSDTAVVGLTVYSDKVLVVPIDIEPGDPSNTIVAGKHNKLLVVIYSTDTFDATTVDCGTLTLAGTCVKARTNGTLFMKYQKDVNRDGLDDMLVEFDKDECAFTEGDCTASLDGCLVTGRTFCGADFLHVIVKKEKDNNGNGDDKDKDK